MRGPGIDMVFGGIEKLWVVLEGIHTGTVDCPQETLRSSVGLGIIASKEYTRQYMQHRICNHITELLLVASNRVCILASTLGLCILYIVCMTMHNSSCTLVPQYYSSTLVVLCIEYA